MREFYRFLRDLIRSRGIIVELTKNDFRARFLGSYLGLLWAFVQPVINIVILWFVFQVGFKSPPVGSYPFVLWIMCGMVPWFFFSDSVAAATPSIAEKSYLVNKPVKTYSSGMSVRLAFAVAIDPEILIIDEALSVGDIMFGQKCYRKIMEFKENNKTIIMVTHDTGAIVNFCTRAIWLKDGEIFQQGRPDEVVKHFVSYMTYRLMPEVVSADEVQPHVRETAAGAEQRADLTRIPWEDVSACSSFGEGGARITGVALCLADSFVRTTIVRGGEKAVFFVRIAAEQEVLGPFHAGDELIVEIEFDFPHLGAGDYVFSVAIADGTQLRHIQRHWVHDAYLVQLANDELRYNIGSCLVLEDEAVRFQVRRVPVAG